MPPADALLQSCAKVACATCAVQDIVTASSHFDMPRFVPQLREDLTVLDSKKRMFLISWITVLASVPDIDMLAHLPELLAGLLDALQDEAREVRTAASKALQVCLPAALLAHAQCLRQFCMCSTHIDAGDCLLPAVAWTKEAADSAPKLCMWTAFGAKQARPCHAVATLGGCHNPSLP